MAAAGQAFGLGPVCDWYNIMSHDNEILKDFLCSTFSGFIFLERECLQYGNPYRKVFFQIGANSG